MGILSVNQAAALIKKANERLRAGRVGVSIEINGKNQKISLRGTFPPKPGSERKSAYQTRISLGRRAIDKESIAIAENTAREVGLDLNQGRFRWDAWIDLETGASEEMKKEKPCEEKDFLTFEEGVEIFRESWWEGKSLEDPAAKTSWASYWTVIKKLDLGQRITIESLKSLIELVPPGRPVRTHYIYVAKRLAIAASLDIKEIKTLSAKSSIKTVNPRSLPSDEEILKKWEEIRDGGNKDLKWLYAMEACYGLRPHELYELDLEEIPNIRIAKRTKTGSRYVCPVPSDWADIFELESQKCPEAFMSSGDQKLGILGGYISRRFRMAGIWTPYTFRHCFARRCFDFGIPVDSAAALMGHSIDVHTKTYRAWIGEKAHVQRVEKMLKSLIGVAAKDS